MPGLISLELPGGLRPGIDFTGGTVMTRSFAQPGQEQAVQSADGALGPSERQQLEATLTQEFGALQILNLDQVSPLIAVEIVRDAILAVAVASAFILLYLWWAFRASADPWSYGTAAVAGLLHDPFAVLGVFSILGRVFGIELQLDFFHGSLGDSRNGWRRSKGARARCCSARVI